ncbi:MAG: right-handed parallel beta-helix repeat-containing protein, partial [Candidatus Staskawiczbacteria bacterium]|nr:right-handed parallel beta-helix repeat-containing protein [Candidatus Staskawiczbacteria bacterium]
MTRIQKTTKTSAILFCAVLLFLGLAGQAFAATYYVAKTGSDSADGSQGSPWLTIQHAADTATAGDTVNVAAGEYHAQVAFTKSGTAGHPIIFQTDPADPAIIDGEGVSFSIWSSLIRLDNASYLTLSGFKVINSLTTSIQINNGTHDQLLNLDVSNSGTSYAATGQIVAGSDIGSPPAFSVISGCKVHDSPGGGITMWGVAGGYWLIENNEVYNNAGYANWDGVQVGVGDATGGIQDNHVIVKNNLIYNNATGGGEGQDNLDLGAHAINHHFLVEGNDIYGGNGSFKLNSGNAFEHHYRAGVSSFHIARFNRFTGIGYSCYGFPSPTVIYNNTFVDAYHTFAQFSQEDLPHDSYGDSTYTGGDTGRQNLKNNIFFQESTSGGYYGVFVYGDVDVTYSSVRLQHNLYRSGGNLNMAWGTDNAGYKYKEITLPGVFQAYQNSSAPDYPDTGSILTTTDASQNFVGYATKDYHLTSTSPAIDAGMALTTATSSATDSTTLVVDRAS